jgi:fatty-acyl-CoA synthase
MGVYDERIATERVVIAAETKLEESEHAALAVRIRVALNSRGILIDEIVFVKPGQLPKTTSGKLNRQRTARELRESRFQA